MIVNKKFFIIQLVLILLFSYISIINAGEIKTINSGKSDVMKHWTKERMEKAIPRDLVIDENGIGYLKKPDGRFIPYGKPVSSSNPIQNKGKPSGGTKDTTAPTISNMSPETGDTIGNSYTFSANVVDAESGIRSVNFLFSNGQKFTPECNVDTGLCESSLQGFPDGSWSLHQV